MGYLNDIRKQEAIRGDIRYTRDNYSGTATAKILRYIECLNQYKYSSDITFCFDSLEELDSDGYNKVRKMLALESLSNITVVDHPICKEDNIIESPEQAKVDYTSSSSLKDLLNKMKGDKQDGTI